MVVAVAGGFQVVAGASHSGDTVTATVPLMLLLPSPSSSSGCGRGGGGEGEGEKGERCNRPFLPPPPFKQLGCTSQHTQTSYTHRRRRRQRTHVSELIVMDM